MTAAPTDAVVMFSPAKEPAVPTPTPAWGADLTVVDEGSAEIIVLRPQVREELAVASEVRSSRNGWMLAVVAVALALAIALTVLAMVTARNIAPRGATPPAPSAVVQAGSAS
jgi:hypothetical protein